MPIDMAFAALVRDRADALFVPPNPLFISRRFQIVQLAARHAVPATYPVRDFAKPGGLTSYGTNTADAWKESKLRSDYQNKKLSSIESKNVTPRRPVEKCGRAICPRAISLIKPCSDLALQSLQQRFRILHVRRIQAFSEPG